MSDWTPPRSARSHSWQSPATAVKETIRAIKGITSLKTNPRSPSNSFRINDSPTRFRSPTNLAALLTNRIY
ncbi:hypothetical protein E2C01_004425 [Portunus trituberculatus]|uniref:Uncharacterized protein n=1 Tax=Portunus trituberculatus TaxID=210409 RepID=A0A5B7CQN2_PORTR|nr:hypothetical protein [Portunus trituberculatus]